MDVTKVWSNHRAWRVAQELVTQLSEKLNDRERQACIHGRRFIENRLVRKYSESLNIESTIKIHSDLMSAIDKHFKDGYLAVVFKNAKKCELLAGEIESLDLVNEL